MTTPRAMRDPVRLPAMPAGWAMTVTDERVVRAPLRTMFALARDVDRWPEHLAHYRWVRFVSRDELGGGLVAMSASRLFGPVAWPTWPLIGVTVARHVIGPVFIHGIANRTLAGLAAVAERR